MKLAPYEERLWERVYATALGTILGGRISMRRGGLVQEDYQLAAENAQILADNAVRYKRKRMSQEGGYRG